MKHKCVNCGKLTLKYQHINGGPWHCYDGCYSTTGWDHRTKDGKPAWESIDGKLAFDKSRMVNGVA